MRTTLLLLSIMFVISMGCRGGGQIYQINNAPVESTAGKRLSLKKVQESILTAGAELGWKMVVARPGEIVGTLDIRSHQAIISIPYNTSTYSILYKDSTNLMYDAAEQTIHANYGAWIYKLNSMIRMQLSTEETY